MIINIINFYFLIAKLVVLCKLVKKCFYLHRSSDTWLEKVEDSDEDISVKNEKQDQEWNTPKLKVIKKKKVKNENRKKKSTTEVQKVKKERKTKKHEPSSYTCNLCDFKVKNQGNFLHSCYMTLNLKFDVSMNVLIV